MSYPSLEDLHGADAKNVLAYIKISVKSIPENEDFMAKLVGFGSMVHQSMLAKKV